MKARRTILLKRLAATVTALLMLLAAIPAGASPDDWSLTAISLYWQDAEGMTQYAYATPVTAVTDSYTFWVMVPADAPIYEGLTLSISHPYHTYIYNPGDGQTLTNILDARDTVDGFSYIAIQAMDPETQMPVEEYCLYVSTLVSEPVLPEEVTPEPETPSPEPITPEPETPTPEPITPEPETPTPEPITPEPETPTPEPITPEPETPTPEPITPEPETPTPEPITPEPETPTPEPVIITPEPEPVTPEPVEAEPPTEGGAPETDAPVLVTEAPSVPFAGTLVNGYWRTNKSVRLREKPSTESTILAELSSYEYVYAIRQENDEWTAVMVNGQRGYVMTKFLDPLTTQDSNAYAALWPTAAPTFTEEDLVTAAPATETPEPETPVPETPTPEPETPTPEPETPTPAPTEAPEVPEAGTMVNAYWKTKSNVRLREKTSTDSRILEQLSRDTYVYAIRQESDEWTAVMVNGKRGYVMTEYLVPLTPEDSAAYDAAQTTEAPVFTEEDLATPAPATATPEPETPTPEPETPTPEPETPTPEPETPTPEPATEEPEPEAPTPEPESVRGSSAAETPIPEGVMINRYGKTNASVRLREKPSTSSRILKEMKSKQMVYLIRKDADGEGQLWTEVVMDGIHGYVMSAYLDEMTQEESDAYIATLTTPPPLFTVEPQPQPGETDTQEPPVETFTPEPVTAEPEPETPTPEPETPTPEPETPTPEPETPTPEPETPTPAPEAPTPEPETPTPEPATPTPEPATPTPEPETPTPEPATATPVPATDTPAPVTAEPTVTQQPTPEPPQHVGYAITIGDGAYVRNWYSSRSVIIAELPGNQVVYVSGQVYPPAETDEWPWHFVLYDGVNWGYIRADMLRMLSESEVRDYLNRSSATQAPTVEITAAPYNPNSLSSYGYVTKDGVNFRAQPNKTAQVLRRLNSNAFCLILGKEQSDGVTWYRVRYGANTGYIHGDYFQQLTLAEMDEFVQSPEYRQGIANNSGSTSSGSSDSTDQTSTGRTGEIVSAEDQRVEVWQNPNSGIEVSYEPFDPFATPEPLAENLPTEDEYLDGLAAKVLSGEMTEEQLRTELAEHFRNEENAEEAISGAMAYIAEKNAAQAEPTETPEVVPVDTEGLYEQEQTGGGSGWLIAGLLILAAGGGAYAWYAVQQKKRQAAQKSARQRLAAQQKGTQSQGGKGNNAPVRPSGPKAAPANNAAKVRTGTYADRNGTPAPKPGGTTDGPAARKPYGNTIENPYARYTSDGEEDQNYTASFRPDESRTGEEAGRRRGRTVRRSGEQNRESDDDGLL